MNQTRTALTLCAAGGVLVALAVTPHAHSAGRHPDTSAHSEGQPTPGSPTAAPPVATCVATQRAPSGLYSDLVVYPASILWLPGDQCAATPEPGYAVLAVEVDNLGSAPSFEFWVRAGGCLEVAVQERVANLDPGDRAHVLLAPVGPSGLPCVVLADASCESDDPSRANNYWEGIPATPVPLTPVPCSSATASPTPTTVSQGSPTATATLESTPTGSPGARFLPRVLVPAR